MFRIKKLHISIIILTIIIGLANSDLHPVTVNSGYTGAPGDSNCSACHSGTNQNLDGSIIISGLPNSIIANQTYRLSVVINNPNGNARNAGFQLVALTDENNNAGSLSNNSIGTNIKTLLSGKSYFGHGPSQAFPASKQLTYQVDWKAPNFIGENRQVKFYASGVIANGDSTALLDRVILTIRQVNVQANAPLSLNLSDISGTSCPDKSDGSAKVSATGGSGLYTYIWSNGITSDTNRTLPPGNSRVTVTDDAGNAIVGNINIPSAPLLNIQMDSIPTCAEVNNGFLSANVTGGTGTYGFLWSNGKNTSSQNGLSAGTYTLTVTDQLGCSTVSETTITTYPNMVVTEKVQSPLCSDGSKGKIDIIVSGGLGNLMYKWSDGNSSAKLDNLESGNYTVTITDSVSCEVSKTIPLVIPTPISAEVLNKTNVSCNGQKDGKLTILAMGGNPDYTFRWSTGTVDQGSQSSITSVAAGTYSVTVTDLFDCQKEFTFDIEEPPILGVKADIKNVSCYEGNDAIITAIPVGNVGGIKYVWSDSSSLSYLPNVSIGKYYVTITDTLYGCVATNSFEVFQPEKLISSTIDKKSATCYGMNDGLIHISVSGGEGPYVYNWTSGHNKDSIDHLLAGTYEYTVTDINNCTVQGQEIIQEPIQIKIISDSIHPTSCSEVSTGFINISANSGVGKYHYLWSNGKTTQNISNLSKGVYEVSVTDSLGCTNMASFALNADPPFLISIAGSTNVLCHGDSTGSAYILPQESLVYRWSNGSAGPSANRLKEGVYSITATDRNGCKSLPDSVTISQPPPITSMLLSIDTVICARNNIGKISVQVSGGADSLFYIWSNGKTTLTIDSLTPNVYTLTVTDKNSCISTFDYKVSGTDSIYFKNKKIVDANCKISNNGSIFLDVAGGEGNLKFVWSDTMLQGSSLNNLTKGKYSVTISDDFGCTILDSFNLLLLDAVEVSSFVINETIAGKKDGKISLNITGGKEPFTAIWNNGFTGLDVENMPPGFYTYRVTDNNNCSAEGFAIVGGGICALNFTASTKPATCPSTADGEIVLDINGPFANYDISISSSAGIVPYPLNAIPAGKYSVVVSDSFDCISFKSNITVGSIHPPIILNSINKTNPTASTANDGALEAIAIGGTGKLAYEWFNLFQKIGSTNKLESLPIGIYKLIVTDTVGCKLEEGNIFLQTASSVVDDLQSQVTIYPNPSQGSFTIENNTIHKIEQCNLIDIQGNIIHLSEMHLPNSQKIFIDISPYVPIPEGLYYLQMKINDKYLTIKIIIIR